MNLNELNDRIRMLIQSPRNTQEFMNLASPDKNWKAFELVLICHHCKEKIRAIGEFTGYTNEIT